MVEAQFYNYQGRETQRVGPVPWLRLCARSLKAGPNDAEVATYHGGLWSVAGRTAPRYSVHGSVCVARFENDAAEEPVTCGPFEKIEVVDGIVFTEPGHHALARLDEAKRRWYACDDGHWWSSLLLQKCD